MTPTDTVRLVALVRQLWPSMKIDEHTPDAWHATLDDVDLVDALSAVRYLARTRSGYIMPADIRRRIAAEAGLLPLSEAEALTAAARVAGQQGVGGAQLDWVTYHAYRDMGGPTGFDAPPGVIRPQWARVYAARAEQHVEQLLAGNLGEVVARKRLAAAPHPPAQPTAANPRTTAPSAAPNA